MADAAHNLLTPWLPSRAPIIAALRTVTGCALEVAAATTEGQRLDAIRADPVALAESGLEATDRWIRQRRLCRRRLFDAVQDYISALQVLTADCSRGAWLSSDEPAAADFESSISLFLCLGQWGQQIPF